MKGEVGKTVKRLSMFLPKDTRREILEILLNHFSERDLAEELGCTQTALRKWKSNATLPYEHTPKALVLALQNCPPARNLLEGVSDEVSRLCSSVASGDTSESGFASLMQSVDERSREIVWYFIRNRHAGIRELAAIINAKTDYDVLTRVKDVINPKSEEVFGKPLLEFEEVRTDPATGDKVLFSWWLRDDVQLPAPEGLLDVFDEGDFLVVITELPGVREKDIKVDVEADVLTISTSDYYKKTPLLYAVENKPHATFKNGILEVRLRKKW